MGTDEGKGGGRKQVFKESLTPLARVKLLDETKVSLDELD